MKPYRSEPSAALQVVSFLPIAWAILSPFLFGSFASPLHAENQKPLSTPARYSDFENFVRPVFAEHCYSCHSATAKKVRGGLKLDTREDFLKGGSDGPIVVPGNPDQSRLITAIQHQDAHLQMPRDADGKSHKLPAISIAHIIDWVKSGAPYPDTPSGLLKPPTQPWAFKPIQNPPPPSFPNSEWVANSVDSFVLAHLQRQSKTPRPKADKLSLIRRATLDLTGLPPTPEEIAAFESDTSPQAFATVVDRLLASPHYGERWGRHWLDVVRYADTAGDTADYPVGLAWKYRNYVIDAFNQDKPYDRFLHEQIAGDILARSEPQSNYAESVKATGFIAISRRFGFDSENYHHLTIQDTLDTLGQAVMGISIGCARCHDHKFDPVSMQDYYALYGIFASTRYPFPGSEQKPKMRSMAPLVPPEQSLTQWRAYDQTLGSMSQWLATFKKSPPAATYRSLHDFDGDFETQKDAAGGSYGVIVPPWIATGPLSVQTTAQSPFKNLFPAGKFGVQIAGGTNAYHLHQTLHLPQASSPLQRLYFNLDFRIPNSTNLTQGNHHIQLSLPSSKQPLAEILISSQSVSISHSESTHPPVQPTPGEWNNLQLTLDWTQLKGSGQLTSTGRTVTLPTFTLAQVTSLQTAEIQISSHPQNISHTAPNLPGLEIDNFALQPFPIAPPSTQVTPYQPNPSQPFIALDELNSELRQRIRNDPDLEWQTEASAPSAPWNAGPNSVVQVSTQSQSPFTNFFSGGHLGIHMPNRAAYDGTGTGIEPAYHSKSTTNLHASFSFRCTDTSAGGNGSWRFYIGHGPGPSAAVQLFFNSTNFFAQSNDQITPVARVTTNRWYQVQLILNLTDRSYRGLITYFGSGYPIAFSGKLSKAWDGTIDHTFVDSYGHIPGPRPAIDLDQFIFSTAPLAPPHFRADKPQWGSAPSPQDKIRVAQIRESIAQATQEASRVQAESTRLLIEGPTEMAYAVAEGTAHDSEIQMRGEPDRPGKKVPRGFIQVLGGGPIPPQTEGSGRLELARWLTQPNHPLTARVMVNRIWQNHFGRGLVSTPNDFGTRGTPPTHPELLDHLASRFIEGKWSIKAMHRLIMLSSAYQQAAVSPAIGDSDPTHVLRRRLSAEEIRDAILVVSGDLDPTPGREHPFTPPIQASYSQHAPFSAVYDHNKRSIYLMTQRIKRHPYLALFDGPDPNAPTAERRTTTVPTQALYFLNSPFLHEKSTSFARRLIAYSQESKAQVTRAWNLTAGRSPTTVELNEALDFLTTYLSSLKSANAKEPEVMALAAYTRSLLGSNEFLHVD